MSPAPSGACPFRLTGHASAATGQIPRAGVCVVCAVCVWGGPGGGNSEPSGDLWVCHGLALPEEDFVEEVAPDGLDP